VERCAISEDPIHRWEARQATALTRACSFLLACHPERGAIEKESAEREDLAVGLQRQFYVAPPGLGFICAPTQRLRAGLEAVPPLRGWISVTRTVCDLRKTSCIVGKPAKSPAPTHADSAAHGGRAAAQPGNVEVLALWN